MAFDRSAEGHREIRSQRSAASGAVERGRIKLTDPYAGSFVCAEAASPVGRDAAFYRTVGSPQQKGGSEICQCRTKLRDDREREREERRRRALKPSAERPRRQIDILPITGI